MHAAAKPIVLTGATGYIGGRLLSRLENRGDPLRCLARRPEYLASRVAPSTEIMAADVLDKSSLEPALRGADSAYYLIHSMGTSSGFEERDKQGAENFAEVAHRAGLRRIIYLGGLGEEDSDLSAHLQSRHAVGEILRNSGVPTLELRASIVIGSGSLSFEMIRSLVERLPVMITPRWVSVMAQPIAIEDVLHYLLLSLDVPITGSTIVQIGGTDRLSYRQLMDEYAKLRGLKRTMLPVPFLTPGISSLWLGFITPLYARIGRKLIDSIRHPTIVTDRSAADLFGLTPKGATEALAEALKNEEREFAETRWSDSISSIGTDAGFGVKRFGNRLIDTRRIEIGASPETVFEILGALGGKGGWLAWNFLWQVRGFVDLLVGGVGMRRGRPGRELRVGDSLDFWRVEIIEPPRRLRLSAEMKLPGRAWLEFEIEPKGENSVLQQRAIFDPVGLAGLAYWYVIYPAHALIFRAMLKAIAKRVSETAQKRHQKKSALSPSTEKVT